MVTDWAARYMHADFRVWGGEGCTVPTLEEHAQPAQQPATAPDEPRTGTGKGRGLRLALRPSWRAILGSAKLGRTG